MDTPSLCIATISLVRNDEEETLLRKSLQQLATLGVPVFVTDGGSSTGFVQFLKGLPNVTVLAAPAKGVFAQAKNSLLEASKRDTPFILYTEPDKEDFFRTGLPNMLQNFSGDANTGILLASRNAEGFSSFPAFQQMTETTINRCCSERTGRDVDYCYGPFLLNTRLVPFLQKVTEDIGWGWRPYLFNLAVRLGYRLEALKETFTCPADQRNDDANERLYRMKQLEQNIRGLVLSTTIPV